MKCKSKVALILWVLMGCAIALYFKDKSSVAAQQQQDDSRQIVAEEFIKQRPTKQPNKSQSRPATLTDKSKPRSEKSSDSTTGSSIISEQRPAYRRVVPKNTTSLKDSKPKLTSFVNLGVTMWRLRPSLATDTEARLLVQESSGVSAWTPERIGVDASLYSGDRVRLSIESPRAGYLYVIDREQYADGSTSDPYLIFPTMRTRGGDNQVQGGKLIDIPTLEDRPNYFTLKPSRPDQVSEVLTVIVTTKPLENLVLTDKPLKLTKDQMAKWEQMWGTQVEQFEMDGGAGQTWTREEREVSVDIGRFLTQEEPTPQTIYRIAANADSPLLVMVPLRFGIK